MTRKLAFVLAAADHGTMILNRLDQNVPARQHGVGSEILTEGVYEAYEILLLKALLDVRRKHYGDGVFALDCGANIGTHTIEMAKHMNDWGTVLAIEAQERIYHALAGNIAINNCFNASALHAAIGNETGAMTIPTPDYLSPGSYGSLELRKRPWVEGIGQPIDYDKLTGVPAIKLDAFTFERIDLMKIDVEGMEMDVLIGGQGCITTHRPLIYVEHTKSNFVALPMWIASQGYEMAKAGRNFIAAHRDDKAYQDASFVAARVDMLIKKGPTQSGV